MHPCANLSALPLPAWGLLLPLPSQGGWALQQLHELHASRLRAVDCVAGATRSVRVHVDVLPAMTGVTRFGELRGNWEYLKTEGLSAAALQTARFDYLLSGTSRHFCFRHAACAARALMRD